MSSSSPSTFRASFTRILPEPDPVHGSPCARSSHGVSVLKSSDTGNNTKVYLYGGENVARTPIEDGLVWIAEKQVQEDGWKWRALSTPVEEGPTLRVAHAQAVVDDRYLYVFGGRSGVDMGETALGDLWCFDTVTETWREIVATRGDDNNKNVPEARSFHRLLAVGSDLYLFGGCGSTSGRLADLHRFDTRTETWTPCDKVDGLRGRGGANVLTFDNENKLAVVGGFCGEESGDAALYDIKEKTWIGGDDDGRIIPDVVRPRSVCVHGSVKVRDHDVGLVFGGEVNPSERGHEGAGGFADDLLLLTHDRTGLSVQIVDKSDTAAWPGCRGWSDADAIGNELFFFGGLAGDDDSPVRLDDLWVCRVAATN